MKKLSLLLLSVFFSFITVYATRVYVKTDGDNILDGTTWETAKKTLGSAMGVIGVTEIWLKAGIYDGITSTSVFKTTTGIKIYGGFKGDEQNISQRELLIGGKPWEFANETIIDGKNATVCIVLPALSSDYETLFDGVVFANGVGEGGAAGMKAGNSMTKNLTLRNCQFRDIKTTTGRGGAIYLSNAYSVQIIDCYFKNNIAEVTSGSGMGGGAINLIAKDAGNKIIGCEFSGNSSIKGGALFLTGNDTYGTEVSNCTFIGNRAFGSTGTGGPGGAFHSENAANKIYNVLVANNEGLSSVNIFKGSEMYYATVVRNKGGINGGATTKIKNSIFWGNISYEKSDSVATLTCISPDAYNNAVYVNDSDGEMKIVANPGDTTTTMLTGTPSFVQPASIVGVEGAIQQADWSLDNTSTLLNKAIAIDGISTDIVGAIRTVGTSDLGAYENNAISGFKYINAENGEIYAIGNRIVIKTEDSTVDIFDVTGRLVFTSPTNSDIIINNAGYYIVKCGNRLAKVIIR